MLRILLPAAFALSAVSAVAAAGGDHAATPESGRKLSATLTGAAEVPGPGDTDGAGTFSARINPGKGELCYDLTASRIDAATAAHIHTGRSTAAGPVLLTLTAPSGGSSSGCIAVTHDTAMELIKDPANYYVNVHNPAFPAGAIRGQLGK